MTGARRGYIETLLEVARRALERRPRPVPLLFLRESHLRSRVELLMEEVEMSRAKTVTTLAASAAILLLAGGAAVRAFPLLSAPPGGGTDSAGDEAAERKLVHQVDPVYPEPARQDKVEGIVVLRIRIEKSGEVSKVDLVRGPESLREATVAAIRQWRYEPADSAADATVSVRFKLDEKAKSVK